MAEVQLARDIGRRHGNRVGGLAGDGAGLEEAGILPLLVKAVFDLLRFVSFGEFRHRGEVKVEGKQRK